MIITNAILHIVDSGSAQLVFSSNPLDLANEDIYDFVRKKIERIAFSDSRHGDLSERNHFLKILVDEEQSFVEKSRIFTTHFYSALEKAKDAVIGDFLFVEFTDELKTYYTILKIDYDKNFTHLIDYDEDEVLTNTIVPHRAIYSKSAIRKDDGILFNVTDETFKIHDKLYSIDDEESYYLSEHFLQLTTEPSVQQQLGEVKRAIKRAAKVNHENENDVMIKAQNAMYDSLTESRTIDKEFVGDKVFGSNMSAKSDFLEILEEKEIAEEIVPIDYENMEQKFGTQKLKLDNGIELSIPIEIYRDKSIVEFVTNDDGSNGLLIKNIESIKNRF